MIKRLKDASVIGAAAILLAGCADREEIADAAMRLAEAAYPGQLEILDMGLIDQFRYNITFGIKGDPITRFDLSLGSDAAECRPGTQCEVRLRKAYAQGVLASSRLKALNRAFRTCGVTLLAPDGMTEAFYIELDMDPSNQQPALDRLHSCSTEYWQQGGDKRPLHFRILRPRKEGPAIMPQLVTFESKLPDARLSEPTYLVSATATDDRIPQAALRIDPRYLRSPPVRDRLKPIIVEQLGRQRPGAELPIFMDFRGTALDPRRADVVHTLVPACSRPPAAGMRHCAPDLAVKLSYDLRTGEATGIKVVDHPGRAGKTLPDTLGRQSAGR